MNLDANILAPAESDSPRQMPFSPECPTEPEFARLAPESRPLPGNFRPPPRPISLTERPLPRRRSTHWSEQQHARTHSTWKFAAMYLQNRFGLASAVMSLI